MTDGILAMEIPLSRTLRVPHPKTAHKTIFLFTFDVHQYGAQLKNSHVTENDLYFLGGHNVEERTVLFLFSTFFINNSRLHQIV